MPPKKKAEQTEEEPTLTEEPIQEQNESMEAPKPKKKEK